MRFFGFGVLFFFREEKQHKHKLFCPDFLRTFLTLTLGCPWVKMFLPIIGAAEKRTFWRRCPRFSARTFMTRRVLEKLCTKKVCVGFKIRESLNGGLANGGLRQLSTIAYNCRHFATKVLLRNGPKRPQMCTIVRKLPRVTLSPHLRAPHLDFPHFWPLFLAPDYARLPLKRGSRRQLSLLIVNFSVKNVVLVAQCSVTPATVAATPPCSATPFQTQISVRHLPARGGGGATPKFSGV